MAWTATLKSFRRIDDRVEVFVELTDGTNTLTVQYAQEARLASKAWLQSQVAATVASFAVAEAELVTGMSVPTTAPPSSPPPPPPPTPAQTAQDQFAIGWQRYQNFRRGVQAGVVSASDPVMTQLLATLKAAWQPGYEDLLGP